MIHECASCSLAEVWFEEDESDVYLNLNRVATEEDLEMDHYLECVGDIIETVSILVVFCPFCGQKLSSKDNPIVPWFQHHNFGCRK